ncbi:M48 family metallopeptidase [Pigmentiphaga litoralis]|uniref:M48 family metallopeptidase n=1 Tax=Pigmentiphaga litoralis TaxID=516702 RepID=UPI003B42D883
MSTPRTVHAQLIRVFVLTLVSLFLIPIATLLFTEYALRTQDAEFIQSIEQRMGADPTMSPAERAESIAYYRSHPLSGACAATGPEDQVYHDKVCSPYSMHWQFHYLELTAIWTLVLGVALLLAALALGAVAYVSRPLRYAAFVTGWRLVTITSAIEVVLQSVMLVWLSFWVTAYFWNSYYVKLIALAGIAAAAAVFFAIWTLFKRIPSGNAVEGELIAEADAPRLWDRIRQLATAAKTTPPDHVVAGIDTNFFVTEAPCDVGGRTLTGRTLFVSLPLLRVLDQTEADAVLAHELAHLGGGDTRMSAALGPKLQQFDRYTWQMREGGLTIVTHYLLRLFRMIIEYALARDSREREHAADRVAAEVTDPDAVIRALIKITAYASYRNSVENRLFAQQHQHDGALGIARFVAEGLPPYARSSDFLADMQQGGVPHPYDSHPPLSERMRHVNHPIAEQDYGRIVATPPAATWVDDIETADAIEQRLWSEYEQRFVQDHELSLAYRYEPATEDEKDHVLRFFPPVSFDLKDGNIAVTYLGLAPSASMGAAVTWDEIKGLTFKDSNFGRDTLKVTHFEKGTLGAKTSTIKLTGLGKRKDEFKAAVGQYWHRHQVMRAQRQQAAETLAAAGAGAASGGTAAPVTVTADSTGGDVTGGATGDSRPQV